MRFKMSSNEAIDEFRRLAPSLLAQSDRQELKALYQRLTAAAVMEGGWTAKAYLSTQLREALLEPSQHVTRGLFEDL